MASIAQAVFGRYIPRDSPVHRMDPRAKLVITIAFIAAALVSQSFMALAACAVFVGVAIALSRIPMRAVARSVAPLLLVALLAAVLQLIFRQDGAVIVSWWVVRITDTGAWAAVFSACRIGVLLTGACLLTLATPMLDITEAFERLLSPLARIGVPAHEIGMMMGITLRFVPQFATELRTIRNAQMSRGAAFGTGPVRARLALVGALIVPLFTSAFRHAETLAQAMDARCYHGDQGRTRLVPLRFAARDAVGGAAVAVLLAAVIAINVFLPGI